MFSTLMLFFMACSLFAEPAGAQTFCSPAIDREESGPNGRAKIVLPSFAYPKFIFQGDTIFPATRLAKHGDIFIKKKFVSCESQLGNIAPDVYALSTYSTTPVAIGSLCSGTPNILIRSYAQAFDSPFLFLNVNSIRSGFLDRAVWDKYVSQFKAADATNMDGILPWRFEHENKLEAYIAKMLGLVHANCGAFPESMVLRVAFGPTVSEALYDPDFLTIRIDFNGDGWGLTFKNTERALEVAKNGSRLFDRWTRNVLNDDGQITMAHVFDFMMGLQLAAEASHAGGFLDVCNRGSATLRISTIALIPVPNPTVFIEGYDFAAPGACARVDGNVHPRMVYGLSIEVEHNDGTFHLYAGEVRDPDIGIPHTFDFICAPEEGEFVRNEVGLIASNPCRPGDRKLPVTLNIRVGRTKFTMNVN